MLTKFNLFEKLDLSDIDIQIPIPKDLMDEFVANMSLIVYKRSNKKKSIRLKSISGYYQSKNDKGIIKTKMSIKMSNKDEIKGEYSSDEKSIKIYINDELDYDVDYKDFDSKKLLKMIPIRYKHHLKREGWKI
jgi:hypothetical protein